MKRKCSKCGIEKPLDEYPKRSGCLYGVSSGCKKCKSETNKKYREDNKDKIKEKYRKNRIKDIELGNIITMDKLVDKKLSNYIEKYVGLEFGSFKITNFDCREKRGNSKYERNYFIKECRFCSEQWSITPPQINKQIKENSKCILCSESVNVHTNEKKCNSCEEWLPATTDYFPKSKNRRFGIHYYCSNCHNKRNIKRRENPENRHKEYLQKKERLKNDELFRFRLSVTCNINSAIKSRGFRKNRSKSKSILCCSIEEFRNYIENKFTDDMTWDNQGKWHLDHQIPVSLANTKEEIIELCHYSNYQPMWGSDNISKGSKIFIDNIPEDNKIRFKKYIDRYIN
jgi:hypothetical protein